MSAAKNGGITTPSDEQDRAEIVEHTVDQWGGFQAEDYLDGLQSLAQQLAVNLQISILGALGIAGLFAFTGRSQTVYYVNKDVAISIVRVLHQSMLPGKQL